MIIAWIQTVHSNTICAFYFIVFLDSPPRALADRDASGCATAPDSSTVCTSSVTAPHPEQEGAAITSTYAGHPLAVAAPPSPDSTPVQSPSSMSKPSSSSSSCPNLSLCPSPVSAQTQTFSLGPRRKGLTRKVRRSQRQRGRQSCTPAAREEERRAEDEEKMEEDIKQDEERMEEETSGEDAGHHQ